MRSSVVNVEAAAVRGDTCWSAGTNNVAQNVAKAIGIKESREACKCTHAAHTRSTYRGERHNEAIATQAWRESEWPGTGCTAKSFTWCREPKREGYCAVQKRQSQRSWQRILQDKNWRRTETKLKSIDGVLDAPIWPSQNPLEETEFECSPCTGIGAA